MKLDYSRYFISLVITVAIFATAFYVSSYFSNKKVASLNNIQNSIAVDILSNETQFLLKEISCSEDNFNPVSTQINELGDKLTYTENELGGDNETVKYLKKYYSLLQIKDYLIGKKIADKCGKSKKPIFMIYMYSNKKGACNDCGKQATVLSELKTLYPELRVYTFDYDLDLAPIETMKKIYKIDSSSTFPILVVEDKAYYGLKGVAEIKSMLPDTLKEATSTEESNTNSTTTINNIKNKIKSSTSVEGLRKL